MAASYPVPRDDDPSTSILTLDAFPPTGEPKYAKLGSWDFYKAVGSPKYVVAPMVDQSELAWRILSRRHGAEIVYTPMINSRRFTQSTSQARGLYHDADFWIAKDTKQQEEGAETITLSGTEKDDTDSPVVVQFCANDPDLLLQAAQVVEPYCSAVDLNLGCPQHIARRGHYGSFLQSDWQLIFRLINTLHLNLRVPVTAKMRVFDSIERTVAYAQMLERAGAQWIAVHGRTREMKGHKTGLADWMKIKAVKESVKVPVIANGNVLFHNDVQRALEMTGADGVMSAEGNLYNPAIFACPPKEPTSLYPLAPLYPFPRIVDLAREYLDICEELQTPTAGSAIKAHFFRLARPALEVHRDLRPMLGTSSVKAKVQGKGRYAAFRSWVDKLADLLEKDEKGVEYIRRIEEENARAEATRWHSSPDSEPEYIPHWLAQPYYRKTLPPTDETADVKEARMEKRKERLEETAVGLTPIDDVQSRGDEETLRQSEAGPSSASKSVGAPTGAVEVNAAKRVKDTLEEAKDLKTKANDLFGKKEYDEAILTYTEALNVLPPRRSAEEEDNEDEDGESAREQTARAKGKGKGKEEIDEETQEMEEDVRLLRSVIYANIAACHSKLGQQKETVIACNESLQDDPMYVKALHRRAQANEQLDTWSSLTSALEDYRFILTLADHPRSLDPSLHSAIRRLPKRIEEQSAREQKEMMNKLKGIGDNVLGWFGLSTDNFQVQKGEGGGYSLNFVK